MNSINGISGLLRDVYAPNALVPATGQEQPKEALRPPPERVPQVRDSVEAEQLARRRSPVHRDGGDEGLSMKGRQARHAYASMAENQERDAVSTLLGIDTYA
jgi:hypothetical protein